MDNIEDRFMKLKIRYEKMGKNLLKKKFIAAMTITGSFNFSSEGVQKAAEKEPKLRCSSDDLKWAS